MKSNNTVNIPELIDDVIDNGVKYTGGIGNPNWMGNKVENAIENGVKETCCHDMRLTKSVEKIIQTGVKNTYSDIIPQEYDWSDQFDVNDVIENGIQETHVDYYHHKNRIDGVIKNGVQETKPMDEWVNTDYIVDKVMVDGVKQTVPSFKMIYNPMNFEAVSVEEKRIDDVTDVIRDGIKEVQPLPAQDGNRDWGIYYYRKGEPTKPHTKYVDEVIENGIKEN
jgi:predicted peroxiredoxin